MEPYGIVFQSNWSSLLWRSINETPGIRFFNERLFIKMSSDKREQFRIISWKNWLVIKRNPVELVFDIV